jgi:hypothetical protein
MPPMTTPSYPPGDDPQFDLTRPASPYDLPSEQDYPTLPPPPVFQPQSTPSTVPAPDATPALPIATTARRGGPGRALAIIGVIVLLAAIGGGGVYLARSGGLHLAGLGNSSTTPGAITTANTYCAALKSANYTQAYATFAAALQAIIPAQTYASVSHDTDTQQGAVTNCTIGSASISGSSATIPVTLTRQQSGPAQLTWQLADQSGTWRFTASPEPSLLARVAVAMYCADLTSANYSAAFSLFAQPLQQELIASSDYTAGATDEDTAEGKATACGTTSVAMRPDGTALALLSVQRQQAESDSVPLAAATNAVPAIADTPDASIPSRAVGNAFCQDLIKKDYNSAFQLFTPAEQQNIGSASELGNYLNGAEILTGPITKCHGSTFTIDSSQMSGTLNGTLTTQNILGSADHAVVLATMEVVAMEWRINHVTVDGNSI